MKTMLLAGDIQYLIWKFNKQLKMMKKGLKINGKKRISKLGQDRAKLGEVEWGVSRESIPADSAPLPYISSFNGEE